jgi:hypothetical protein
MALAIDKGRVLANAGQYNEAIELLTAENRKERRRELDKMLLTLRSEGFLGQDWNTQSPEWPASVPDQFDGEGAYRVLTLINSMRQPYTVASKIVAL